MEISEELSSIQGGTLNDIILYHANVTPDKIAFIQLNNNGEEVVSISYKELVSNAIYVSKLLLKRYRKGDRCIIVIPAGIEFVTAFLGCLHAGIIAVPSNIPKRNKDNSRFWSIIYDSKSKCILTNSETKEIIENQLNSSTNENSIESVLVVNTTEIINVNNNIQEINADDLAFLQYTSGSINMPKGIKVTHSNLLHNSEIIKQSFNHTKDLVVVTWLPPFHDMGLIGCMLQPLYVGGSCIIIKPNDFIRNPAIWFEAISKYQATTVGCPNFALDYCIEKIVKPDVRTMDLSSLKVLFCGSESVRKDSLSSFITAFSSLNFKKEMFLPCYGLAEATLMVSGISQHEVPRFCQTESDNQHTIEYTSCGRTWNNTDLIIVDPVSNLEILDEKIGEIWVKSDSVCEGYWEQDKLTNELFKAYTNNNKGPYLRTGDLGFCRDNNICITGRLKELIIIRGLNYFPSDIENIVDKCHPALQINSCAVFSVEEERKEKLVVIQEVKRVFIRDIKDSEIFESITKSISDNFEILVDSIVLIKPISLSKTSSGKIKRLYCKTLYLEDKLNVIASLKRNECNQESKVDNEEDLLVDEIICWIKNWLANKLCIEADQIDSNNSILSYGLDSIGAVELETDINNKFNVDLFVGDFFENNSIKYLAKVGINNKRI